MSNDKYACPKGMNQKKWDKWSVGRQRAYLNAVYHKDSSYPVDKPAIKTTDKNPD